MNACARNRFSRSTARDGRSTPYAAYDAFRDRLVEELGVDPSRELCELHRDVLCHAPGLAVGLDSLGSVGARTPLWTSLVLPFVGRGEEEETIFCRIREVFAGSRMMMLVEGETGIGKTRLVLEIARRVQDDAIVLSATANDSMRPAVVAVAHELVAALVQLPDDELRCFLGRWPSDLAAVVPSLRDRLPDLVPADIDVADGGPRLVNSVASGMAALSRRAPIVLLLDDLHLAGASLLTLLGRLMVVDEQQRILVLATARSQSPNRSSHLADLAELAGTPLPIGAGTARGPRAPSPSGDCSPASVRRPCRRRRSSCTG